MIKINNFIISLLIRKILTVFFQFKAKLTNKRFYCDVLTGKSDYNLVINSDMTISCNCQDYYGTGHIGDLRINKLSEIYNGSIAKEFRKKLAKGILPILTCSRCSGLKWINTKKAHYFENNYSLPKFLQIENTVQCNLNCLACERDNLLKTRKNQNLNMVDIEKIALLLKEYSLEAICYFNLGEPFLSSNIHDELKILRKHNPKLHIGLSTNGILIDTDEKREAALLLDQISFSIHGYNNITLTKYQINGDFDKAYKNLIELVKYRDNKGLDKPIICWRYILFSWNDKKKMILKAIKLAREANIDQISFWHTKSPFYGISWRYYVKRYFKKIGIKTRNVININFRILNEKE